MSNQQNTLFTHIAALCCLFLFCRNIPARIHLYCEGHYSIVVIVFASGAEVPLAARVWIPIGAEAGVMPTILLIIFMPFSKKKKKKK